MSKACGALLAWLAATSLRGADPMLTDEMVARALVSGGNPARLQRVLAQARRGEAMTVGVIGGSITQGARASRADLNYGSLLAAWWRQAFPGLQVTFRNAGIGATGSNLGAHRVQADLLAHAPDLVVVEYAVNDAPDQASAETLEGLVRQVLKHPRQPAVILLFTMHRNGGNAQAWHGKVGAHYGLPMVSFRDAVWPEIEAGRLKWEDVEADEVHPNDVGHCLCADLITRFIETVRTTLPPDAALAPIPPVPTALFTDLFEHARLLTAKTLSPARCEGWSELTGGPFGPGWRSDTPGSVLEFEVWGRAFTVVFHRLKGDMGRVAVSVDGGAPTTLEAWFNADWGGYSAPGVLPRCEKDGPHRLRVELRPDKAPESRGNRFELRAILAAGAAEPTAGEAGP